MAVLLLLLLALMAPAAAAAPDGKIAPLRDVTGKVIAGRYLVILDGGGSPLDVANRAGVSPLRTYRSAVVGFTAQLTSSQLASVRRNPAVAFVEPDQVFTASATQTMDTPTATPGALTASTSVRDRCRAPTPTTAAARACAPTLLIPGF